MANLLELRNLSLTPAQWAALEELARQTNSRSTRGPDAHQISWRCLFKRLADGELHLVEKAPYKIPEALDRALERLQRPPLFETEAA